MNSEATLAALAARQFGVVSKAQALAAGLDLEAIKWKTRSKQLMCVHRNVYRFPSHGPSWEQRAMSVCLLGNDFVLSHRTAGHLHGLDGLARPERLDVLTPAGRRLHLAGVDQHTSIAAFGAAKIRGLRVTNLARTVIDLASVLDEQAFEVALDSAHRLKPSLARWLPRVLEHLDPGLPGTRRVHELLQERLGKTESALERKVRRVLCRARLPMWVEQSELTDAAGRRIVRADFAWVAPRVALFVDSYRWHHGRQQFDRDLEQRRALNLAGWSWVAVTSTSLARPEWLVQLVQLLRARDPQLDLLSERNTAR